MDVSLMAKMNEFKEENRRLKKLYVDARMRAMILEEALAKK
jgi:putative transposase